MWILLNDWRKLTLEVGLITSVFMCRLGDFTLLNISTCFWSSLIVPSFCFRIPSNLAAKSSFASRNACLNLTSTLNHQQSVCMAMSIKTSTLFDHHRNILKSVVFFFHLYEFSTSSITVNAFYLYFSLMLLIDFEFFFFHLDNFHVQCFILLLKPFVFLFQTL